MSSGINFIYNLIWKPPFSGSEVVGFSQPFLKRFLFGKMTLSWLYGMFFCPGDFGDRQTEALSRLTSLT